MVKSSLGVTFTDQAADLVTSVIDEFSRDAIRSILMAGRRPDDSPFIALVGYDRVSPNSVPDELNGRGFHWAISKMDRSELEAAHVEVVDGALVLRLAEEGSGQEPSGSA